jgi:cytoskeletal protein RodZ
MSGASEALGERFRAAREARGMSVSDVAEQIRIRSLYLAAIEDENWNMIGAPVYVRGFLRTYARFLGLDPEEAVAAFNRTQPVPQTPAAREAEQARGGSSWAGPALLWGAGIVAVLLIAFVVFSELTMPRRGGPATVVASAAPVAASPATSAPPPTQTPAPAVGGAKSLALVLSAPSWLRVTVDGNVSMEGTFPAGTSKTFHGNSALLRIGNAGGVEVYVDGKDVGKLGKQGDVVEHAFTL